MCIIVLALYIDLYVGIEFARIAEPDQPVLRGHSKRRPKLVFKTDYRLMQVKNIAECSKGSILQYFRPSLSYQLSLSTSFCLFLSGRLRQVNLCAIILYSYSVTVLPHGMQCPGLLSKANGDRNQLWAWLDSDPIAV